MDFVEVGISTGYDLGRVGMAHAYVEGMNRNQPGATKEGNMYSEGDLVRRHERGTALDYYVLKAYPGALRVRRCGSGCIYEYPIGEFLMLAAARAARTIG